MAVIKPRRLPKESTYWHCEVCQKSTSQNVKNGDPEDTGRQDIHGIDAFIRWRYCSTPGCHASTQTVELLESVLNKLVANLDKVKNALNTANDKLERISKVVIE